jgi:hypothetical protein
MDEELIRDVRKWLDADLASQDEDADAACRTVFAETSADPVVPLDFAARTMEAIGVAAARDALAARRMRRALVGGSVAGGLASLYLFGGWAISEISDIAVALLNLLVGATVRIAGGVQAGADIWTVLSGMGHAVAAFVSDPTVTIAMLAMQGIAIAALFALQRLLGTDTESFK